MMVLSLASWVSSPSSSLFFIHPDRLHLVKATVDSRSQIVPPAKDQIPSKEVTESVNLLKTAAKTRKVAADEILAAFSAIEKAKVDPSTFLQTLGGTESPGRTWMLIFTAEKKLTKGRYFPLTAVQRFDAAEVVLYYNLELTNVVYALLMLHTFYKAFPDQFIEKIVVLQSLGEQKWLDITQHRIDRCIRRLNSAPINLDDGPSLVGEIKKKSGSKANTKGYKPDSQTKKLFLLRMWC